MITTKSCKPSLYLCYPSCVEVIVEVAVELVDIPLSVEVIEVVVWLCVLSLW